MQNKSHYTFQQINAMAKIESVKLGRVVKPSEVCLKIWTNYVNETLYNKLKNDGYKQKEGSK